MLKLLAMLVLVVGADHEKGPRSMRNELKKIDNSLVTVAGQHDTAVAKVTGNFLTGANSAAEESMSLDCTCLCSMHTRVVHVALVEEGKWRERFDKHCMFGQPSIQCASSSGNF